MFKTKTESHTLGHENLRSFLRKITQIKGIKTKIQS